MTNYDNISDTIILPADWCETTDMNLTEDDKATLLRLTEALVLV